jgi:hypothetical protein
MAFRFGDPGGRIYGSGTNLLLWWTTQGANTGAWSVAASAGRTTGSALRMSSYTGGNYLTKLLDSQSTWGVALAVKPSTASFGGTGVIVSFIDATTTQVDLRLNQDYSLQFTRNGTSIGSASVPIISPNVWLIIIGVILLGILTIL